MNYINHVVKSDNFSDLYKKAIALIFEHGIETQPRSLKIKEIVDATLILTNPRNRTLASKARKHSNAYAAAEFLWYWRGSNSLDEIAFYSERLRDFSDDGKTLNSAYGHRIFGKHPDFPNQWDNIKQKLLSDKDTRQAVININYSNDQNKVTKDVTCTLALQYFIRENKLHAITTMRSNDLILGTLYDLFCFTMFQEMLLYELNKEKYLDLELGYYIHKANSFHIYENFFERSKIILTEDLVSQDLEQVKSTSEISSLLLDEEKLRTNLIEINELEYNGVWKWFAQQLNKKLKNKKK